MAQIAVTQGRLQDENLPLVVKVILNPELASLLSDTNTMYIIFDEDSIRLGLVVPQYFPRSNARLLSSPSKIAI